MNGMLQIVYLVNPAVHIHATTTHAHTAGTPTRGHAMLYHICHSMPRARKRLTAGTCWPGGF